MICVVTNGDYDFIIKRADATNTPTYFLAEVKMTDCAQYTCYAENRPDECRTELLGNY